MSDIEKAWQRRLEQIRERGGNADMIANASHAGEYEAGWEDAMASQGASPDIKAALAKIDAAWDELSDAVKRQWGGEHALKISIPAREDRDSDLVIMAGLKAARDALKALRGDGEFADWRVNDDGSVSPPGRLESAAVSSNVNGWYWRIYDVFSAETWRFFPDAARALLRALEASDGRE